MSAKTPAELISELSPIVTVVGLELDDLKLSKAGKYRVLEIAVDGDFVDLDKIAEVSRALSVYLDEKNPLGEQPYTLEVTTRGIDRPLVKPVHWQRNVSRLVKVTGEAVELIGRITKFENPTVTLDVNGKIIEIDINTISSALIQVEFSRRVVGEQD